MTQLGCLIIRKNKDWTNHSKVVIRTDNHDLLQALLLKTSVMSANGFGCIIYHFGCRGNALHIFSQLGKAMDVLTHLLEGQDYSRLSAEAAIETVN
jgi:hypothetical protein